MKKSIPFFVSVILITSLPFTASSQVKDIDGNIYKTIKIGTQLWTAENLKTTRLNDGTKIPVIEADEEFYSMKTPSVCWYKNDKANKNVYGGLYNWYTVKTGKLCPAEWHVPSDAEWMALEKALGMSEDDATNLGDRGTDQGTRLKSATGWTGDKIIKPSGFAALPSGMRADEGSFLQGNDGSFRSTFIAAFWSSTPMLKSKGETAYYRSVQSRENTIMRINSSVGRGHSIRCVKDLK